MPLLIDFSPLLAALFPQPGQPGAPLFDGKDVSVFLRKWERFAAKYQFSPERKIADLVDYCEPELARDISTFIRVSAREAGTGRDHHAQHWEAFCRLALRRFRKDDSEQQRISVTYLRGLVSEKDCRNYTGSDAVELYIYHYSEISEVVVKKQLVTVYDQTSFSCRACQMGLWRRYIQR